MPADDSELDSRATDRLMLFSDAVVAIAITLLAIDLPVPGGDTVPAFFSSVRDNSGHYWAFLLSFGSIAGAWGNHHDIFRCTRRIDARLRQLNVAWLLMIVLTPFAARVLTARGHQTVDEHALRLGFYALVQAAESGIMVVMLRYMTSHGLAEGLPEQTVKRVTRSSLTLVAGFGLSIPVLFATSYAWFLWLVVPLAAAQWFRSRQREAPAE